MPKLEDTRERKRKSENEGKRGRETEEKRCCSIERRGTYARQDSEKEQ